MIRKHPVIQTVLILTTLLFTVVAQGAQIVVAGKHTRADGSVYDFDVIDGDALSPGDRFQIIIDTDKNTYYAVLYFSRDGKAAQIFPPAGQRGLIRSGTRQFIPGTDNYFTLDVNGGRELMFVVTSPNALSNLKSVLRGAESATSPAEIKAYLQKRLPQVHKLEITNTGKSIASTTDQVSSSLVRDIERTYAQNPWPDTFDSQDYGKERVRRGDDNSIPEEVRRRTAEVRSLLKRPKGTTGSSSLRTVQSAPSQSTSVPAEGEIRRDATMLRAQKEKQEEEARIRQERLAEEERKRQQELTLARQEREAAEDKAKRLQVEREEAERLEAERIAEAEAVTRELELKRQAIAKAEAEARLQAELRAEQERVLTEQQQQEERRLAKIREDELQQRLAAEKAEEERIEAERIALQQAREKAARLTEEQAETSRIKAAEEEAAKLLAEAEQRAREEEKRRLEAHLAAEEARRLEEQRVAKQAAAENARKLGAQRLAAEEAGLLEAERQALAEAEAQVLRREEERALAEQQRLEKEQAEVKARQLADQHAAEEADRRAAEAMRQAEIAAEEQSIQAEQRVLEEKLRLAEQEEAASDKKTDKGLFGAMLALVSGDDSDKGSGKEATDERTTVIETDSTGEVILNEPDTSSQIEITTNTAAAAPREAVVALQAAKRPAEKKMSAPAPVRVSLEDGKSMNATGKDMGDMAAQIASAIVSIRTTNDPQASGFILDSKGHILTSWHVINGVTDIDVSFMAISGAPRTYKARVVKYNKFHDLALLQLVNPPEGIQPITVSGDELPDAGSTVRVFGQKDGQIWATDDAVITRIAPHFTWFSQNNVIHRGEVLQVDLPAEGKDIGSLVTTMDYQMLGVKSFSGSQTGRAYAVSVRMIRDFVEDRGTPASKPKTQ